MTDSPAEAVTHGQGPEGFPHGSIAPVVVAAGLFLLAVGLLWLPVLAVAIPVLTYGLYRWVREYAVDEFERAIIPEQKRRLLGIKSGSLTIWLVIVSEIVVFGALFASLLYLEAVNGPWPPDGLGLNFPFAIGLTVLLVSSGIALHLGHEQLIAGNRRRFLAGVGAAFVLGALFLLGQAIEYVTLYEAGLTPTQGPYGSSFYALTGVHGAHVAAGLILIGLIGVRAWRRGHFSAERDLMVRTTALYWHFVDAVWLLILVVVYFRFAG